MCVCVYVCVCRVCVYVCVCVSCVCVCVCRVCVCVCVCVCVSSSIPARPWTRRRQGGPPGTRIQPAIDFPLFPTHSLNKQQTTHQRPLPPCNDQHKTPNTLTTPHQPPGHPSTYLVQKQLDMLPSLPPSLPP